MRYTLFLALLNGTGKETCHPYFAQILSFNNISNILRYVYEKPPYNNRKCGTRSFSHC